MSTPLKSIPSATVCISDLAKQEQTPIMYIDVMLTPNDPCDRIPIYQNDDVKSIVKEYIVRKKLDMNVEEKLV